LESGTAAGSTAPDAGAAKARGRACFAAKKATGFTTEGSS
jgi:hypothetical protein